MLSCVEFDPIYTIYVTNWLAECWRAFKTDQISAVMRVEFWPGKTSILLILWAGVNEVITLYTEVMYLLKLLYILSFQAIQKLRI